MNLIFIWPFADLKRRRSTAFRALLVLEAVDAVFWDVRISHVRISH